jgi:hypothetical protein
VAIAANMPDNVPAGACTGGSVCDGAGGCKKTNGQMCGGNTECLSGHCVDGYCCNSACGNQCDRCDKAGALGTCSVAPVGTPPSPSCNTVYACDGSTTLCPAQSCSTSSNCLSGYTCQMGTCQTCRTSDQPCGSDSMCCSLNCVSFKCL